MLSAALRGAPAHGAIGPQFTNVQPKLPPVLQSSPAPRLASSLADEPFFEQLREPSESPRAPACGIPLPSRPSAHAAEVELDAASDGGSDIFGAEDFQEVGADHRSVCSSQTQHCCEQSYFNTPSAAGPMTVSLTSTPALLSAGPSGEFTIGRAVGARGSAAELQAELEHLSSYAGGRGTRPIGIPRAGPFMASTYHPAAGAFMTGFVPPHELAAASVQDADNMVVHSHRHKSTAERLRTAVFEQTGHMSLTTGQAFLQAPHFQPKRNK